MIKHTAQPPAKRFNEIRQSVQDLVSSSDQCLRKFGIKISTKPAQLRGRVLDPPSLVFENSSIASHATRWTLLNLSRFAQRDSLDNFVKMLIRIGQELGMRIEQPLDVTTTNANRKPVRNILPEEQRRTASLEMVISVLAKNTNYAEIKQVAETEIGLGTQCVMDNNKINVKLDGINNSLLPKEKPKMFQKPVIIIGADMEKSATTSRLEIIKDLKDMMKDMLKAFYRATRHKPERIIFFPDGVSEGQFMEVRNREVSAIRLACQELSPNETYEPALTFIVVQKRHHMRFMPANDRDGVGRCRNVPPGTTVDSAVAHPFDFDFYLCSHFCLQGTSRPSHYYIVWDDSSFTADELQKLCYYLCHTYASCSRSVSIPAPVYYAHLAAYRARNHVMSKVDVTSSSSDSSGGSADSVFISQYFEAVKVLETLQNACTSCEEAHCRSMPRYNACVGASCTHETLSRKRWSPESNLLEAGGPPRSVPGSRVMLHVMLGRTFHVMLGRTLVKPMWLLSPDHEVGLAIPVPGVVCPMAHDAVGFTCYWVLCGDDEMSDLRGQPSSPPGRLEVN
ncbi:protein argonaute-2-like [Amblyomma americanum]